MPDTQFIHLRARGLTYDKIAADTGISKRTLVRWAKKYQVEIARLKYEILFRIPPPCDAAPDGPAQETYFHNLNGCAFGRDIVPVRKLASGRKSPSGKTSALKRKFRRFMQSPLVQAAIRYAIFKR